jgi:hypothetical protein
MSPSGARLSAIGAPTAGSAVDHILTRLEMHLRHPRVFEGASPASPAMPQEYHEG